MISIKGGLQWASITFALLQKVEAGRRHLPNINITLPYLLGDAFGVPTVNRTFDYIVVGGGTGGLAIAYRLAEKYSVAVVEAGSIYQIDNGNGSVIPGIANTQFTGPDPSDVQPLIDWNFVTQPQAGANNRRTLYARGKTLGGSSARNYMVYHLPTVGSLDSWAEEVGDQSFAWNNTFQYFTRSAQIFPANQEKRAANSSTGFDTNPFNGSHPGPVPVTWPNYGDPFASWAAIAFPAAGLPLSHAAYLDGKLAGLSAWTASTIDPALQQRASSATSYLARAILDTDLVVYTQTLAKEILFDPNNTATGVKVATGGIDYFISAKREVILSAGAFQSPQLLMLSGIGPRSTLEALKITVRHDLEGVGRNLQDHVLAPTSYQINVETSAQFDNPEYARQIRQEYLVNRTGPLTSLANLLAWERLSSRYDSGLHAQTVQDLNSARPSDWPDVEYLVLPGPDPRVTTSTSINTTRAANFGSILVALIAPFSRGTVTINSTDAADPPIINPNWLTDPRDGEVLVAGLKRARSVWRELSGVTIGDEVVPGTNITSDADLLAFARETLGTVWHPSATCKMGKQDDPMAVVDSKARVFGVNGLRVVDAAAFPFLTPGHPQSVVYMLAEKIAHDILHEEHQTASNLVE